MIRIKVILKADVKVYDIKVLAVKVYDIKAHAVKVYDIKAFDVKVRVVKAFDIKVYDVKAFDIKVYDVKAIAKLYGVLTVPEVNHVLVKKQLSTECLEDSVVY